MTDKRKILLRWIAIFTCVTLVTVGVTLAVCFSNQRKNSNEAVGFIMFKQDYIATPYGDILHMEGTFNFRVDSSNGKTMAYGWSDKTFSVISQYGIKHVEKKVNRLIYAALFISHDGEVIYFIDDEERNDSQNSLWRYVVATDTIEKIDTIEHYFNQGMISPNGNYFALLEEGDKMTTIHLYDKEKEVQRHVLNNTANSVEFYFVTDAGTIFYEDGLGNLKSVGQETPTFSFTTTDTFHSVLFNRDCTEMIVNCEEACYFYRLKNDVMIEERILQEGEKITVFLQEESLQHIIFGERFAILNINSFRDINLKNIETSQRMKLTKDYKLVGQEGSDTMLGKLAPGSDYLYYVDDKGDYFYTDTDDVNGDYHLLWEASECEGAMLIGVTAQRSLYYWDAENNIHYVKNGKDKIIFPEDAILEIVVNPFTDTIYILSDNELYYSSQGSVCRKMFDVNTVFSAEPDQIRLTYAPGQVYCYDAQEDLTICKLYSNGRYQVMEAVE